MSFELWFTANFKTPKTSQEQRMYYERFWKGYVAYHDANVDRVEKVKGHSLRFDWATDSLTVNVMLDPLLNPQEHGEMITYSLPAVVTAAAASSDPPLPPPPKR